ncbi:cytochrome c oxidase subunit I [Wenzhouxiangella sp. AB-CW3]|uniref:cytochrome c oxidase subunit I n=1 Tax=Wenzhouxiangella sp. AB-CW3 TaxID=2771012 RepID=UPI00168BEB76|nr:cytochrome c oxidase subunit I [Wenzhouxiangella sp. AB-CW3]QOC21694.1 cytochrome c oxidase subunit I [Wenzhouxiangella sp. AB-CW3]
MSLTTDQLAEERVRLDHLFSTPPGFGRLAAVNHSVIGLRFIIVSLVFFVVGGLLSMLIRAQLAIPGNEFLDNAAYNQIFTMHGTVMMFLFAIPLIEGLALYFIPKFLGARDLSFPRLSAFGFWCFVFGGSILLVSMFLGVAPDSGWFMYTPLSSGEFTPGINADVWLIGVTFVEVSAIAFAIELVTTVLKVRSGGMSLSRMPLWGWYILVTALMMVVGFPPLILASILLEIERAFSWPFFNAALGGDPLLWQHLFWLFGHPEVYIIFLPAAAAVSMMIPTFARRAIVGYNWVVAAVVATGFISFGLWVHHMFTVGIPHLALVFFSAASMFVAIPTAIQFFSWLATLWKGRPVARLPMLYLFGFLFIFVCGGLTGVMLALVPFNWQAHDTHFVVAHLHYVLIGGFVFPLLAAAYYWLPLISGKAPSERLGKWAFWLIFIGFNLTFLHMHFTGLVGMPRRVYTYPEGLGWEWLNLVSSIGGFVLTIGFAAFFLDLVVRLRAGPPSPINPWQAGSLEWSLDHPPATYNFAALPHVTSREPLRDQADLDQQIRGGEGYLPTARNGWQETLGVHPLTGRPDQIILLPGPSYLPLITASLLAVFFVGFLLGAYWVSALGAAAALVAGFRWAWSTGLDRDWHKQDAGRELVLPLHAQVHDAPGWWGMLVGLLVNGTFYITLLFGYLYLWAVAPEWPPESFVRTSLPAVGITLFAVLAALFGFHRAVKVNAGNASPVSALILALAGGLIATAGLTMQLVNDVAEPTSHAYAAVTSFLLGYLTLHAFIAAMMGIYALLRWRAGFISPLRSLDLRVIRLWALYTALVTLIGVALVHGLPPLLGESA